MMPDSRPTKRQLKAAATGDQLLAAARDTFEARGYAATTVGAITSAANTAHGTFYLHFKNKEDAFGKVMESVLHDMYVQVGTRALRGDARTTLAVATRGYLDVFRAHAGLWRALLEGMLQNPSIADMWLALRQPFLDRIAHHLDGLQKAGEMRPVDSHLAASALGSMCEWFAFTTLVLPRADSQPVDFDDVVETLTDVWFHAVHGGAPAS